MAVDDKASTIPADEPSMDDILASIRRIITDDEKSPEAGAAAPAGAETQPGSVGRGDGPSLSEPASVARDENPPLSSIVRRDRPILSPGPRMAAAEAFGLLPQPISPRAGGERSLEDVARDLLRPMLKTWLDENLPGLVEKLVREEIERVARG